MVANENDKVSFFLHDLRTSIPERTELQALKACNSYWVDFGETSMDVS